jgi:putative transposase
VFAAAGDYAYYLESLKEWKIALGIKVYAYCLMTNHVHLVIEPNEDCAAVGKLMRRLAGRQTRFVNALEGRVGTLWSGRYKASPIQTDEYLLACCRYVEMNPVRAGMTASPSAYEWSSYGFKIAGAWPEWMDTDECYRALGTSRDERAMRYKSFVEGTGSAEMDGLIRQALNRNQLTGNQKFVDEIERRLGRRIELRGRGRPPAVTTR